MKPASEYTEAERAKIIAHLQATPAKFDFVYVPFGCSIEEAMAAKREGREPKIDEEWVRRHSAPTLAPRMLFNLRYDERRGTALKDKTRKPKP